MSSSNRATSKGGKGAKTTEGGGKAHGKTDGKTDTVHKSGGGGNKQQSTSSDGQLAQIKDLKSEDPSIKEKVRQAMEMTCRPEEEVCLVLHDCDYDLNRAANILLEGSIQGEYETSIKKKKNRQTGTSKSESGDGGGAEAEASWDSPPAQTAPAKSTEASAGAGGAGPERERSKGRGGAPTRSNRGRDSRGWRGRENKDGDRDKEEGGGRGENFRRNRMPNGPGRGGGRGGRGGRMGPRSYQSRDGQRSHNRGPPMETWNSDSVGQNSNGMKKRNDKFSQLDEWDNEEYVGSLGQVDTWNSFPPTEDWDNEEYTGSLADTKVFLPSQALEAAALAAEGSVVEPTSVPNADVQETPDVHSSSNVPQSLAQAPEPHELRLPMHLQQPQSTTLSAAQTQYLNQFTQQPQADNMKAAVAAAAAVHAIHHHFPSQQYQSSSPGYTASQNNAYNSQGFVQSSVNYGAGSLQDQQQSVQSQQPSRPKTQRARVPPPSKIPASAVEMPGDLNTSIGAIDVQFGGLDLVSENSSFETENSKYLTNNTDLDNSQSVTASGNLDLGSSVNQTATALDSYSTSAGVVKQTTQSSMNAALVQNQILPNTDSISQASEHLSSASNAYTASRGSLPVSNALQSAIETVNKTAEVHNSYSSQPQTNSYQSYQGQKSNAAAYQAPAAYISTNYSSSTQVTSSSSYPSNQSASYSSSNTSNSAYNNQSTVNNSYQTSSYSTASSYPNVTPAFTSITQPNSSFPTNNQSSGYQATSNQSVYASTTGIPKTDRVPPQYNYNSNLHKLATSGKDQSQYDPVSPDSGVSGVSVTSVSSVSAAPALSGLSQTTTAASTKVTSTSTAKSGVLPNLPPSVAPMMSAQYIMGNTGMPFYQQPVYSYEELQLLQQRIPHMTTGYYDIPYQAPTSLAAAGERGLASVAYSMSDGRFPRADNNASPVPSTISQQTTTQAHQGQPMLSGPTLPPGYAYFYNTPMMPQGFQYGTPTIYPQIPAATNAHGSTTSSQYPKPGSYGSGYNSGYDALSQTQDYNKSAYVGGNQSQNKTGVAVTTGSSATDLTSAMYGKSHVAIGKVNSYDKQGFHSGTPPPFNLAGSQSAGLAPSGQYAPHLYIPTMAPHQTHHNTTLMHQPLHQMDVRQTSRRTDSGNSSGQRSQSSNQAKPGSKQTYQTSYWNQA